MEVGYACITNVLRVTSSISNPGYVVSNIYGSNQVSNRFTFRDPRNTLIYNNEYFQCYLIVRNAYIHHQVLEFCFS